MDITDVRMNLVNKEGRSIKAIGSFSLDGEFAVRGVRVMEDKNGRNFVAFPSREKSNGEYEDIAFPLSKEFYHKVTDAIIEEYNHVAEKKQNKHESVNNEKDDTPFVDPEAEKKNQVSEEKPARKGKSR